MPGPAGNWAEGGRQARTDTAGPIPFWKIRDAPAGDGRIMSLTRHASKGPKQAMTIQPVEMGKDVGDTPAKRERTADLKEACIVAAQAVIAEKGVEALSLRDVARRLNVSHQAPYRHYPSRDHLLAEVIRRCFLRFSAALERRTRSDDPLVEMKSMGERYLEFALHHPLEYRLMFGTPWPDVADHPDLQRDSNRSFQILSNCMRRQRGGDRADPDQADLDAMFVWSTMHGIASILQSNLMTHLPLSENAIRNAAEHVMQKIEAALAVPSPHAA